MNQIIATILTFSLLMPTAGLASTLRALKDDYKKLNKELKLISSAYISKDWPNVIDSRDQFLNNLATFEKTLNLYGDLNLPKYMEGDLKYARSFRETLTTYFEAIIAKYDLYDLIPSKETGTIAHGQEIEALPESKIDIEQDSFTYTEEIEYIDDSILDYEIQTIELTPVERKILSMSESELQAVANIIREKNDQQSPVTLDDVVKVVSCATCDQNEPTPPINSPEKEDLPVEEKATLIEEENLQDKELIEAIGGLISPDKEMYIENEGSDLFEKMRARELKELSDSIESRIGQNKSVRNFEAVNNKEKIEVEANRQKVFSEKEDKVVPKRFNFIGRDPLDISDDEIIQIIVPN